MFNPVGVFSLEMSATEIGLRLVSMWSGVRMTVLRHMPTSEALTQAQPTMSKLFDAPLWLCTQEVGTADIRHIAGVMKARHKVRMIVVDYIGLVRPDDRSAPRHEQIAKVSRDLKVIAEDLGIAVLGICQINRGPDKEKRPPRLTDLRDSGAVEQDADVVLLLDRQRGIDEQLSNDGTLYVAKQRNGEVGSVPVRFDPQTIRFYQGGSEQ